jgi:hypothetical protein
MAENTKLILRLEEDEIFKPQNYKIHPTLIENPLWPSLLDPEIININRVIGIHYNGEIKSVSELNNEDYYNEINDLRKESDEHPHITKTIEDLEGMKTEWPSKLGLDMLNYLVDNLYDTDYATNMYMIGKHTQVTLQDGRIYSPYDDKTGDEYKRISGYIKVEGANEDITLNMIIRGVPIPMRKTLTSKNYINGVELSNNYIFTYPQYLLDNVDMIQAIQYIEVNNPGSSATFWYGTDYNFSSNKVLSFTGYEDNLANIHIINKSNRNLNGNEIGQL